MEEQAAIVDGELHNDHNCPENLAMMCNAMAVQLQKNPPRLEAPFYHLVMRMDTGLLPLIGDEVAGVLRAIYHVGRSTIAIVGFDVYAGLQEVTRALYPYEVPAQNTNPDLSSQRQLESNLVGGKKLLGTGLPI